MSTLKIDPSKLLGYKLMAAEEEANSRIGAKSGKSGLKAGKVDKTGLKAGKLNKATLKAGVKMGTKMGGKLRT